MMNPMIPPTAASRIISDFVDQARRKSHLLDPISAPIFTVAVLATYCTRADTDINLHMRLNGELTFVEGRGAMGLRGTCNDGHCGVTIK
jgi:hypothetical protein